VEQLPNESFLGLPPEERADILKASEAQCGLIPHILEKDVWVCWSLDTLFKMPNSNPMAFKGGTSLSKVYNAISRFSEDVDVTIDYRSLDPSFDPFQKNPPKSRNGIQTFSNGLKQKVAYHIENAIAPHFRQALDVQLGTGLGSITIEGKDRDSILIHYPTALETGPTYLGTSVKVEFGGRNSIDPREIHSIEPYISRVVPGLDLPRASVHVLSAARTFWEKATLIHVECGLAQFRSNVDRLSRHWYDIDQLANHEVGLAAMSDKDLLQDVVKLKKVFYNSGHARYDDCLSGNLRLIPDDASRDELRADYEKMIESQMFTGEPPEFVDIMHRLTSLESRLNSSIPGA
jgi:hypothetical protein